MENRIFTQEQLMRLRTLILNASSQAISVRNESLSILKNIEGVDQVAEEDAKNKAHCCVRLNIKSLTHAADCLLDTTIAIFDVAKGLSLPDIVVFDFIASDIRKVKTLVGEVADEYHTTADREKLAGEFATEHLCNFTLNKVAVIFHNMERMLVKYYSVYHKTEYVDMKLVTTITTKDESGNVRTSEGYDITFATTIMQKLMDIMSFSASLTKIQFQKMAEGVTSVSLNDPVIIKGYIENLLGNIYDIWVIHLGIQHHPEYVDLIRRTGSEVMFNSICKELDKLKVAAFSMGVTYDNLTRMRNSTADNRDSISNYLQSLIGKISRIVRRLENIRDTYIITTTNAEYYTKYREYIKLHFDLGVK